MTPTTTLSQLANDLDWEWNGERQKFVELAQAKKRNSLTFNTKYKHMAVFNLEV